MTKEELDYIAFSLYGVMDDLTNLSRSMLGAASYPQIEGSDAVNKLMQIESSIHKLIHRMQVMEKDGEDGS